MSHNGKPRRRPERFGGNGHGVGKPRHRGRPSTPRREATEVDLSAATDASPPAGPLPSFEALGLPSALVSTLAERGIDSPFPIQAATMPDALAGRDVLGRAQTGSGKTLAFGLPMLAKLAGTAAKPLAPRGLVLVPTRELAMQVKDALAPFARALGMSCALVVGGMPYTKQITALRRGVDLLVATPGRLSDHLRQGTCTLSDVRIATLDEADQMADMGFLPQVMELFDRLTPDGQRLLFSATLDGDVAQLVRRYLTEPVTHSVTPPGASVSAMEHHVLVHAAEDKADIVAQIGARSGRTIMFVRTKHGADRLTKQLRAVGVAAGALHGGKTQGARTRTLSDFRDGNTPVLVATDVAARGIHVDNVDLVVHIDPPTDSKAYLHRAGRTARAGEAGTVVTLVERHQRRGVERLTRRAGVRAASTSVRADDDDLARITGARSPSGVPVADPPAQPRRRAKPGGRFDRGRAGQFRHRTPRGARNGRDHRSAGSAKSA